MARVTDLVTVTTLEISLSVVYSFVWSKEVLLVHGHLEIIHGRATWTIRVDELHCSGVPMCCPFFGRLFVQTALLALDESLDEQEMGLSSCFPIKAVGEAQISRKAYYLISIMLPNEPNLLLPSPGF